MKKELEKSEIKTENYAPFKPRKVWKNIFAFILLHGALFYTIYLIFTIPKFPWYTFWFDTLFGFTSISFGIGICAHRCYAHNAFRGRWPLRIFLNFFQTTAGQNCTYDWARDHRVHHKFSDTDADPHNINRGFFFSHIGWLMLEKHPDVKIKGATIDMSDMRRDWVVMWQKKYYMPLAILLGFVLPTFIPMYFWGEIFKYAFFGNIMRYMIQLHVTWCINSFAHTFGSKPFDRNIRSVDVGWMGLIGLGEGWHNYHHTFPWDYKCSDLLKTELTYLHKFIEFFAYIGMAYDLKTVSREMVRKRVQRTGDGTHVFSAENNKNQLEEYDYEQTLWGWDDKDITELHKAATEIHNVAKKIED